MEEIQKYLKPNDFNGKGTITLNTTEVRNIKAIPIHNKYDWSNVSPLVHWSKFHSGDQSLVLTYDDHVTESTRKS